MKLLPLPDPAAVKGRQQFVITPQRRLPLARGAPGALRCQGSCCSLPGARGPPDPRPASNSENAKLATSAQAEDREAAGGSRCHQPRQAPQLTAPLSPAGRSALRQAPRPGSSRPHAIAPNVPPLPHPRLQAKPFGAAAPTCASSQGGSHGSSPFPGGGGSQQRRRAAPRSGGARGDGKGLRVSARPLPFPPPLSTHPPQENNKLPQHGGGRHNRRCRRRPRAASWGSGGPGPPSRGGRTAGAADWPAGAQVLRTPLTSAPSAHAPSCRLATGRPGQECACATAGHVPPRRGGVAPARGAVRRGRLAGGMADGPGSCRLPAAVGLGRGAGPEWFRTLPGFPAGSPCRLGLALAQGSRPAGFRPKGGCCQRPGYVRKRPSGLRWRYLTGTDSAERE